MVEGTHRSFALEGLVFAKSVVGVAATRRDIVFFFFVGADGRTENQRRWSLGRLLGEGLVKV